MKRIIKYLFIALIGISFANAKPELEKIKNYRDDFIKITKIESIEDGYVAIGNYENDYRVAAITKFDKEGNKEWLSLFGEREYNGVTEFYDFQVVEDGYIVVGYSDFKGMKYEFKGGHWDAFIMKYDKNGKEKWVRTFGGKRGDTFSTIEVLDDGYLVLGETGSGELFNAEDNFLQIF